MLPAVNAWPHHSVSRVKCGRRTSHAICRGDRARSVSSSSAAADMERQPPSTDQRAVSTIQHDEMEDVHNESKRAKIIGGMEVCVLDDGYDEWPDEPGLLLENQEGSE